MNIAIIGRTHFLYDTAVKLSQNGHCIKTIITAPAPAEYRRNEDDFKNLAGTMDSVFFRTNNLRKPELLTLASGSKRNLFGSWLESLLASLKIRVRMSLSKIQYIMLVPDLWQPITIRLVKLWHSCMGNGLVIILKRRLPISSQLCGLRISPMPIFILIRLHTCHGTAEGSIAHFSKLYPLK